MAGQIRTWSLQDARGREEIEKAYRLARTHPAVAFIAGDLRARQGRWEEAKQAFKQALARKYSRQQVMDVYLKAQRPDLAAEVFAEDWDALLTLARTSEKDPKTVELGATIRHRAENVLREAAKKPDAPVQTLAAMADLLQKQGDLSGAASHYRRAIDGNYAFAEWHLALSRILAELGDTVQANQEAAIGARLRQKQ
jgi:tetratricopeptide (TPR) repeat protein